MYPSNYRYTKEHEWIDVKGDTGTDRHHGLRAARTGRRGIRRAAQSGRETCRGKIARHGGIGESRERNLFSRVGRSDRSQRQTSADSPETINKDPHGAAWLIKLKLSQCRRISSLMDAAAYENIHRRRRNHISLMRYLPKSPSERQEMLAAIGVESAEELFASIPRNSG